MIVLQATHDIRKLSLWLGHTQLTTTEMYVRADPSEKLEAIEAIVPPHLRKGTFRPTAALLAWLKAPRYGESNGRDASPGTLVYYRAPQNGALSIIRHEL